MSDAPRAHWLTTRASVSALLGAIAASVAACAFVLDASAPQCRTDADCAGKAGDLALTCNAGVCGPAAITSDAGADAPSDATPDVDAGPWGCVGNAVPPEDKPYTLPLHVQDGRQAMPGSTAPGIADAGVSVCKNLDTACTTPLAGPFVTNGNGDVSLSFPPSQTEYVNITAPSFTRLLLYPGIRTLPYNQTLPLAAALIRTSDVAIFAELAGATAQPGMGHLVLGIVDCALPSPSTQAGVSFAASPMNGNTKVFYLRNSLPSDTETMTDSSGAGGFFNLSPGPVTITATLAATQMEVARKTLLVQPDSFTQVVLEPGN